MNFYTYQKIVINESTEFLKKKKNLLRKAEMYTVQKTTFDHLQLSRENNTEFYSCLYGPRRNYNIKIILHFKMQASRCRICTCNKEVQTQQVWMG